MSKEYEVYLEDILNAIEKIELYTKDLTFKEFAKNSLVIDGVSRNLEIIGEAVKNLPDKIKKENPEIEWKKIAGLRDVLIHAYSGIDVGIVWDVVANKLPIFNNQIKKLLKCVDLS